MKNQTKKEMVMEYKERKIIGGVFLIKNTINGKALLCSAQDLNGAKNKFIFSQKTNTCTYMPLKKEWDQYGGDVFLFEVLEEYEKKAIQSIKDFKEDLN